MERDPERLRAHYPSLTATSLCPASYQLARESQYPFREIAIAHRAQLEEAEEKTSYAESRIVG